MGCLTDRLAADIINDCDNLTITGIETDVVVIPHSDVDKVASIINATNRMLLDNLDCVSGATGFLLEGVKQLHGYNTEFIPSEETTDKHRHSFNGVILTPSAENRLQASKMSKGESYMVIVHKRYKGANQEDAFLVLGWDTGLYISEMTEGSTEADSAIVFVLSSKDDSLEYDAPRVLLETDHATTLAAFVNKFATP